MKEQGASRPIHDASREELHRALMEVVPLQKRYADLYDEAPCGYVTCDTRQHITGVNRTFATLVGQAPRELIDQPLAHLVHSSEADQRVLRRHWKWLCAQATTAQCEVRLNTPDEGGPIVHLDSRSYFDPRGRLFEVRVTVTDMTAQRAAEEKVRQRETMYRNVVDLTPNPLFCIAADGSFQECNTATLILLGIARDDLLRSNARDCFRLANPAPAQDVVDALWSKNAMIELECARNGEVRTLHVAVTQVTLEGRPHVFVIGTEVTAHKHAESALRHDVLHDRLTGLPNRQGFIEEVERAIKRMRREKNYRFGLLFIDIDHFKKINDSFGHLIGDHLLREVGARLSSAVREVDVLARFAGDEFTILIKDVEERADVDTAARRVLEIMQPPVLLGGTEVRINVSVGGTISRPQHAAPGEIVREADDAMYSAKRRGRNGYVSFGTPTRRMAHAVRQTVSDQLRHAITHDELVLHYQPIVALHPANEILGLEALVRWPQKDKPCLAPSHFLHLIQEVDLHEAMTRWVIRETCRQILQWDALSLFANAWYISMNVPPQLVNSGDLAGMIKNGLNETGIDPRRLAIEVSGSALIEGCKGVDVNVLALHRMGLRLLVHDFGSGHAQMNELCGFPVDGVKIEPPFVRLLDQQEKDRRVLRGLVALAQGLGFHVTAVGVETQTQLERLQATQCDAVQGFLFGQPLPADPMGAWIAGRHRDLDKTKPAAGSSSRAGS